MSTPLIKKKVEPLNIGWENHWPAFRGACSGWGETCYSFKVPGINTIGHVYIHTEERIILCPLWETGLLSTVCLLSPVLALLVILNKYSMTESPLNRVLHSFYNSLFYCWSRKTKWFVSLLKAFLVKWFPPDWEAQSNTSAKSLFTR